MCVGGGGGGFHMSNDNIALSNFSNEQSKSICKRINISEKLRLSTVKQPQCCLSDRVYVSIKNKNND